MPFVSPHLGTVEVAIPLGLSRLPILVVAVMDMTTPKENEPDPSITCQDCRREFAFGHGACELHRQNLAGPSVFWQDHNTDMEDAEYAAVFDAVAAELKDNEQASMVLCSCGHSLYWHFEGCCFVKGCYEASGVAPCPPKGPAEPAELEDAINGSLTSLITYERRLQDAGDPVPQEISEAIATLRKVVP